MHLQVTAYDVVMRVVMPSWYLLDLHLYDTAAAYLRARADKKTRRYVEHASERFAHALATNQVWDGTQPDLTPGFAGGVSQAPAVVQGQPGIAVQGLFHSPRGYSNEKLMPWVPWYQSNNGNCSLWVQISMHYKTALEPCDYEFARDVFCHKHGKPWALYAAWCGFVSIMTGAPGGSAEVCCLGLAAYVSVPQHQHLLLKYAIFKSRHRWSRKASSPAADSGAATVAAHTCRQCLLLHCH
jgi:hypothetical protein